MFPCTDDGVLFVICSALLFSFGFFWCHMIPISETHWLLCSLFSENFLQDTSDSQWRNFRGNLPILSLVLGIFTLVASTLRSYFNLKAKGMSIVWLLLSFSYLSYLHGAWYTSSSRESSLIPSAQHKSTYSSFYVAVLFSFSWLFLRTTF